MKEEVLALYHVVEIHRFGLTCGGDDVQMVGQLQAKFNRHRGSQTHSYRPGSLAVIMPTPVAQTPMRSMSVTSCHSDSDAFSNAR